ncbi:MAG: PH domain-containing protein [Actinomycetota bacterium]|nr:PH domain-containing protein [Actinomycetota bacterium]
MALGIAAILCCVGIVLPSALNPEVSLVFTGLMLLGAAAGWVLFVRPSVVLTVHGVHLNNPLRRTVIPWAKVQDVSARWNLEVYADDKSYPAWAIASHIERPQRQGLLGLGSLGPKSTAEAAAPPPSRGATVGSAAALIEDAMTQWSEMRADGRPETVTDGEVVRTWDLPDLVVLGIPVLLTVAGFMR